MSIMKCSTCGDSLDSREGMHCNTCGAVMCPNCAEGASGVCNHCFDELNYYH